MASISDQTMDGVVHVFNTVVLLTTTVGISSIGEWCVIRHIRDKLICHGMEAGFA